MDSGVAAVSGSGRGRPYVFSLISLAAFEAARHGLNLHGR